MRFKLIEDTNKNLLDAAQDWLKKNNPSTGWSERGFILRDGYITTNPESTSQYSKRTNHDVTDKALQRYLYGEDILDRIDVNNMLTDKLGFIRVNGTMKIIFV